jgi:ketosteroid isomerase-like protein
MGDPDYLPRKELARANRAFYQSFERLDLEAMRALWLDDPMVRCIHPGGEVLVGRERVIASWGAIFANTERIRFDIEDLAIELAGDMGWVTSVERIKTKTDEGPLTSEAAVTNLFVRRDGEWRMVLHHASPIARRFFRD